MCHNTRRSWAEGEKGLGQTRQSGALSFFFIRITTDDALEITLYGSLTDDEWVANPAIIEEQIQVKEKNVSLHILHVALLNIIIIIRYCAVNATNGGAFQRWIAAWSNKY